MKAIPRESWLLPLVCAPVTPQPRPSNTVPSPPMRKLKHTVSSLYNTDQNKLNSTTFCMFWTNLGCQIKKTLTYIQCHQSLFPAYAFSECWQAGPCTQSGFCSLGMQCGVWRLAGQSLPAYLSVEGQLLPTAASKQYSLNVWRRFKVVRLISSGHWSSISSVVRCHTFLLHNSTPAASGCDDRLVLERATALSNSLFEEVWSWEVRYLVLCCFMSLKWSCELFSHWLSNIWVTQRS